jgi:hypothetical protein
MSQAARVHQREMTIERAFWRELNALEARR